MSNCTWGGIRTNHPDGKSDEQWPYRLIRMMKTLQYTLFELNLLRSMRGSTNEISAWLIIIDWCTFYPLRYPSSHFLLIFSSFLHQVGWPVWRVRWCPHQFQDAEPEVRSVSISRKDINSKWGQFYVYNTTLSYLGSIVGYMISLSDWFFSKKLLAN